MKRTLIVASAGIALISCNKSEEVTPPTVKKIAKELTTHNHKRIDNYFWLNDRENPEVIDYLKAENAYLDAKMKHTKPLQESLYNEIKGRIKQEDNTVPVLDNGYYYYRKTIPETEYYVNCRKKGSLKASEEVLLDVNQMAKGKAYYQIGGLAISPNNKIAAFGEDVVSRRKYKIRFKNLETGKHYKDEIPNTTGSVVWANDNKTVFYTLKNETTLRSEKIMRHTLGTPTSNDIEIYFEKDDTFSVYAYKTKSKKYIVIGSDATMTTESRIIDANKPFSKPVVFQKRERGHEYSIDHADGCFYIRTNNNAQNFKLAKTSESKRDISNWVDILPVNSDVFIQGFELFNSKLVVSERFKGIKQLKVYEREDMSKCYVIDFGEDVYVASISSNPEFNTDIVRVGYTSMTTPRSTFDFNMKTKEMTLLKQTEVLGNFNKDDYKTKRIYATARDGKKVPISIVYKNGVKKDASNPVLLYAYGSYGSTMDPTFSYSRLSLLNRGFIYAIAHIRGGQVNGRHWYEDGKLLKKKNTFTDFIDCGKFMKSEKWCHEDKLFGMGGSAGGLLIGAVVNMEPSIWKGVVAAVPFVDVVTTMLDESIPLTTGEFDEWGNPKIKKYYDYMLSYSPYDNVEKKDYPAMLVTTGLHDSQVQYFEPAKWVAKLRDMKTDKNSLLMRINMDYGHGGASGRFQWIKETAEEYAFLMNLIDITE